MAATSATERQNQASVTVAAESRKACPREYMPLLSFGQAQRKHVIAHKALKNGVIHRATAQKEQLAATTVRQRVMSCVISRRLISRTEHSDPKTPAAGPQLSKWTPSSGYWTKQLWAVRIQTEGAV